MEIGKNRASNPLESQKHPFSAFPTPWKIKITHFLRFQPLGKTKSLNFCFSNPLERQKCPENRPSSADETQKTMKMDCRRPTKHRIAQFSLIVGQRNEKSSPKLPFGAPRRAKNCSDTGVNHRLAPSVARFFPRIKKNSLGKRHLGYRFSENYINFVLHLSLRLRLLRGSSSKAATEFRQNAFLQR